MTDKKDQKAIIVKGIAKAIDNLYKIKCTPHVITPEGCFYKQGNELIPEWIFLAAHPVKMLKNRSLQDDTPDTRAIF